MPSSPRPRSSTRSGSKPLPRSSTSRRHGGRSRRRTVADDVPACLATLLSASWTMRSRAAASAGDGGAPTAPLFPRRRSRPRPRAPPQDRPGARAHADGAPSATGSSSPAGSDWQLRAQRVHLEQGAARELVELVELGRDLLGRSLQEQQRRPGGERHAEQRLGHRVVQVARQALPLPHRRQTLGPGGVVGETAVRAPQIVGQRLVAQSGLAGALGRQGVGGQKDVGARVDRGEGRRLGDAVLRNEAQPREQTPKSPISTAALPDRPAHRRLHAGHRQQNGEEVARVRQRERHGDDRGLQRHVDGEPPRQRRDRAGSTSSSTSQTSSRTRAADAAAVAERQHRAQHGRRVQKGDRQGEDPAVRAEQPAADGRGRGRDVRRALEPLRPACSRQ